LTLSLGWIATVKIKILLQIIYLFTLLDAPNVLLYYMVSQQFPIRWINSNSDYDTPVIQ